MITTTEDHPFWSVTDQRFERADELTDGEQVLDASGHVIAVSGLELGTAREALAYNLSVDGIHTYHVGQSEILVHNTCPIHGNSASSPDKAYLYRLYDSGNYLKTGISKNPQSRYSQTFMQGKDMEILQSGTRREMLNLERFIVERDPGPLNRERWAGDYLWDVP